MWKQACPCCRSWIAQYKNYILMSIFFSLRTLCLVDMYFTSRNDATGVTTASYSDVQGR